jgi:hypothetical protein
MLAVIFAEGRGVWLGFQSRFRLWGGPYFSKTRVGAILSLAVYMPICLGISISGSHKSAARFPCEDCPCGCSSPEDCWTHCCCSSLDQKMAWALREHVIPPDSVRLEVLRLGLWSQYRCVWEGGDCEGLASNQRETNGHAPQKRACCCDRKADTDKEPARCCQRRETTQSPERSRSLLVIAAMKCNGQTTNWLGVPISVAPPLITQLDQPLSTGRVADRIFARLTISHRPPAPPPRTGILA